MASEATWNPGLWTAAGGRLPPGWKLVPFADLLESPKSIAVGVMYPGDHVDDGIPLVRVGDVQGGGVIAEPQMRVTAQVNHEYRRTELRGDELLITLVGKPGACVIARPKMRGWNVARALAVVRLRSPSLRPYLKAVLESSVMKSIILGMLNTTVQPTLNLKEIKSLPVPLPADEEIAGLIGGFSELFNQRIDLLRQTNTTLESIAQALFKSWFIDFDPVRAKQAGREPDGMDAATAALFPAEFEESALGLIPKGWPVRPFAETVDIVGGGTPKTSMPEYWDGDIPWFSVVDAPAAGQVFTVATEKSVTKLGVDNSSTRILPKWTTIISARGTIGKLAMTGVEMAMNQSCYGLKPRANGGETTTYLAAQRLVEDLKRLAHGGVFDTITRDTLNSVLVCDPPPEVVKAFDALTRPLFERILANGLQSRSLTETRDTLLPRLISGKLRLSETQEQLEPEGALA